VRLPTVASRNNGALDLERAAELAVEAALASGAGEADAWCEESVNLTVRAYAGAVENLTEAGGRGVGVRAFVDGRSGYAYGSDLSEAGIEAVARTASETAAVTEPDEHAGLPQHCGAADVGPLASSELERWTTERKVELALAVERAARERDPLISNVEDTVYSDGRSRAVLANSSGFSASYEETECYAYAYAFAGEGDDLMTGLGVGAGRSPDELDPEAIGREAADRALSLHGARQPKTRRCPVVLDPYVAASFLSIIGGTFSARAVQRGRSPFAGKEGEQVASAVVRLADDGLDPDGLATTPFDGEGVPHQRTQLIEDGVLRSFLFDRYTAHVAGRDSTGNGGRDSYRSPPAVGATNLVLEGGDGTSAELIAAAGEGFYVMDVTGLHSGVNPVSGTFSAGASGRLISGGELGSPAREVTIASDLVSMLTAVRAVSSEARWLPFAGSVKVAPILIGEMAVGGA
jgi:PmbA protein